MISKFSILFFFIFINFKSFPNIWTWSYKKKISVSQSEKLLNKNEVTFSKVDVPNYNQLIFSWNSLRPKKGFFSFYIKPRYSKSKKWGKWYKIADWGCNFQRSYSDIVKNSTSHYYVRLELPINNLADGFKIKVVPNDKADLSCLRMLSVCISDFSKFKIEFIKDSLNLPSIEIKNVPKKSQMVLDHKDNNRMCSATSTSMLLGFLLKKLIDPIYFGKKIYDTGLDTYGNWAFNTAAKLFIGNSNLTLCSSHNFRVTRLNSFKDIHHNLINGFPVIVSVRGKMPGAPKEYQSNSGHVVLVIGFDRANKKVIVHDPAFPLDSQVRYKYDLANFIRAWERSHRLAYVIEKR